MGSPEFVGGDDLKNIAKAYEKAVQKVTAESLAPPRITEKRCHVCTHEHRNWIEHLIVQQHSYLSIEKSLRGLDKEHWVDRRSISNHYKEHMSITETAYRAIMEEEANLEGQNFETGVRGTITMRGILDILARKGFEDVLADTSHVEPKDLIQIVKLKMDMDSNAAAVQVEELRMQVGLLQEAVQNVIPPGMQADLVKEIQRLRKRQDLNTPYETIAQPKVIESSVEPYPSTD